MVTNKQALELLRLTKDNLSYNDWGELNTRAICLVMHAVGRGMKPANVDYIIDATISPQLYNKSGGYESFYSAVVWGWIPDANRQYARHRLVEWLIDHLEKQDPDAALAPVKAPNPAELVDYILEKCRADH